MENNKSDHRNVDEYLNSLPAGVKEKLETIRHTIKTAVPEAQEVISYQMPAFKYKGMLAYYAAFKNHYSLFLSPRVVQAFKKELATYELSKATIKIPLVQEVPVKLITKIVKFGAKENLLKAELKAKRKK